MIQWSVLTITCGNLEWENHQAMPVDMGWADAHTHIAGLNSKRYAVHEDWRLPTVHELFSLADHSRVNPAIDPCFSYTAADYYWSSTTYAYGPDYAWGVYFLTGSVGYGYKSFYGFVRAVRGGS
jgi:hypothetical protein